MDRKKELEFKQGMGQASDTEKEELDKIRSGSADLLDAPRKLPQTLVDAGHKAWDVSRDKE